MNNGGRSPRCPVLDKSAAARPLTCAGLIGRQTIKACLSPKCARGRGREHFCHRIQPDHGRVASAVSMGVVQHRPPTQGSRTRILGRLQVASRRKGPVRMATGRLIGHRTPATGPAELSALRARMLMRWPACSLGCCGWRSFAEISGLAFASPRARHLPIPCGWQLRRPREGVRAQVCSSGVRGPTMRPILVGCARRRALVTSADGEVGRTRDIVHY